MITGLPPYRTPIEQSMRCVCGLRYLVYLGAPFPFDGKAMEGAKEQAVTLGARFIDARSTPWLICSCAEVLVFVEDAAAVLM